MCWKSGGTALGSVESGESQLSFCLSSLALADLVRHAGLIPPFWFKPSEVWEIKGAE